MITMKENYEARNTLENFVCRQCCPWKQRYDKWFKVVELRQHREKQPSKKSVPIQHWLCNAYFNLRAMFHECVVLCYWEF